MHDTARHVRVEIPQFGLGGHANGLIAGLYFASVKFGTPPKEYHLQIDTGSSLIWISCTGCIGCPTESLLEDLHYFDPGNSTTVSSVNCRKRACTSVHKNVGGKCLKSNQCGYHLVYGGGRSYASGYILIDQMTFEAVLENTSQNISSTPIIFGCSTNLGGQLATNKKSVDGILGLGRQDISVLNQLASTGQIPWVFSECLWSAGTGGGFLVFGEALDKTLTYTPLRPSKNHYIIALTSIAINGQILYIDPTVLRKGAVIDSGTTLAYLVDGAYYPFSHAVNAVASEAGINPQLEQDLCYSMPISRIPMYGA
ncbi:Xylanase inhibitor, N-terminal [Dillenia turbinata]|uniref:Xylanase inhibitor, N-terminal n=1 Tax=Dillenia turbinata TaxID=194707 RepID=A0AAN8VE83_9MAGN